jgi:hypothetical protein
MPGDSSETRLAEIFSDCAAEMLSDLGVQAARLAGSRPLRPTGDSTAAFASFGNEEVRGSLTLVAPSELFSRLHPLPPNVSPRDLDDWACEMVNQAVGRFRNRLAAYGTKVKFGVPLSALAELLDLTSSCQTAWSPILFAVGGMVLECWLELDVTPDFRLAESRSDEIEAALKEGTIILF